MSMIWLSVVILLAIVELLTINLTTIWFVASGLVSLIMSIYMDNFTNEFAVFVILGLILLITTRPMLLKMMHKTRVATNLDRIIGMKGKVLKDIPKNSLGEVKVDGKIWFAYSDEEVDINETVEVLEINGTKLKVKGVN